MGAVPVDDDALDLSSLLDVNRLDYRLPPALSVATSRSTKTYPASRQSYGVGDHVHFTIGTGAQYVDFLNSFIRFKVTLGLSGNTAADGSTRVGLPVNTSLINVFRSIRLVHSSGQEIDRLDDTLPTWCAVKTYYNCSASEKSQKQSFGYLPRTTLYPVAAVDNDEEKVAQLNAVPLPRTNVDGSVDPQSGVAFNAHVLEVTIPLCELHDFFDNPKLAPSYLASGLRLELTVNNPTEAFVTRTGGPTVTSLTITDAVIGLEAIGLSDGISRRLGQISAERGLVWHWDTVLSISHYSADTAASIQVNRAISRANQMIAVTRKTSSLSAPKEDSITPERPYLGSANGVAPRTGGITKFQVQLGAEYIPTAPVTTSTEAYHTAMKTFYSFRRQDKQSDASLSLYHNDLLLVGKMGDLTSPIHPVHNGAIQIAAVPLETSSTLGQSGVAINAQRTAIMNMNFPNATNRRIDVFVTATKLAVVMLDSITLRS